MPLQNTIPTAALESCAQHKRAVKPSPLLRFSSLLLSLALALSVFANILLFGQAQGFYIQVQQVRLDPLGLGAFPTIRPTDSLTDHRPMVVFYGDSRAAQWPAPSNLAQYQFLNRGIGAQTSAQVLARFDQHIAPLRPRFIVVQVGINDLKTIPLFPDREKAITANCQENIHQIVGRSVDLGATIILTTVFPVGQVPVERQPFWSPEVARAVERVNTDLSALKSSKVTIFDAYAILAENGTKYYQDTLHLNSSGYAVLNQQLSQILRSLD